MGTRHTLKCVNERVSASYSIAGNEILFCVEHVRKPGKGFEWPPNTSSKRDHLRGLEFSTKVDLFISVGVFAERTQTRNYPAGRTGQCAARKGLDREWENGTEPNEESLHSGT